MFLIVVKWEATSEAYSKEGDGFLKLHAEKEELAKQFQQQSPVFVQEQSNPTGMVLLDLGARRTVERLPPLGVVAIAELHRPCAAVVPSLMNALSNLPGWEGQIFHGSENAKYFKEHSRLQGLVKSGLVTLHLVDWDGLPAKPRDRGATEHEYSYLRSEYNDLCTSTTFWTQMRAENVLITQADARVCTNSKRSIDDFMQYDYIGAPWPEKCRVQIPASLKTKEMQGNELIVGNGGFSLRSKSAMLTVTSMKEELAGIWGAQGLGLPNEDTFLSFALYWLNENRNATFNIPSPQIAATFAIEIVDDIILSWNGGDFFGGHDPKRTGNRVGEWHNDLQIMCPDMMAVFEKCNCDQCLLQ